MTVINKLKVEKLQLEEQITKKKNLEIDQVRKEAREEHEKSTKELVIQLKRNNYNERQN